MPMSFKLVGAGLLVLLIGFFMSLTDLRFMIWGKHVRADVMDAAAWVTKSTGDVKSIELAYRFTDDKNELVTGGVTVNPDFRLGEDGKVDVIYVAGKSDTNRLASKSRWMGFLVLLAGVALTAFGAWYFNNESVSEAHAETARSLNHMKGRTLPGRLGL